MLTPKVIHERPAEPSRQTSLLVLVKCLCEAAAENYEKASVSDLPKGVSRDEREWARELQRDIAAAHERLGGLIQRSSKT